jgi:N-formylglutamate deformylase
MTLPLLISVPHAGLAVPPEAAPYCILTEQQIVEDGDEGAADIYLGLEDQAAAFVTTSIARAIVDVSRAEDDFSTDGVIKTHTCWNVPVYDPPPTPGLIERLLASYYRPYQARLSTLAAMGVRLGVDCHTMAAFGPPVGPDPGRERPWVCLSNGGQTCPDDWIESLAECFARAFEHDVAINEPFKGGYIVRSHATELPWVQVEISRAPFISSREKHARVVAGLSEWCGRVG